MLRKTLKSFAVNALTSLPVSWLMQPLRNQFVPVFMLHRFADPQRGVRGHAIEHLEAALQYLNTHGYQGVSVPNLIMALKGESILPPRSVVFTLDDGFYDQAELALPLFEHYRFPVTLFLATDMPESLHWSWDYKLEYMVLYSKIDHFQFELNGIQFSANFDDPSEKRQVRRDIQSRLKQLPQAQVNEVLAQLAALLEVKAPNKAPPPYQPITWAQVRRLESALVSFGPHSCRHEILSRMSDDDARAEIEGSWSLLSSKCANPVPVFCYPTGRSGRDFGPREQQIVKDAGLVAAFSSDPGNVNIKYPLKNDLYALKRMPFPDSMDDFRQYCSWLERAKEKLRAS